MTPKQRIEQLEYALFEIHGHMINIGHHNACIKNILQGVVSKDEYRSWAWKPGKNPMFAKDIYEALKPHFEKDDRGRK